MSTGSGKPGGAGCRQSAFAIAAQQLSQLLQSQAFDQLACPGRTRQELAQAMTGKVQMSLLANENASRYFVKYCSATLCSVNFVVQ